MPEMDSSSRIRCPICDKKCSLKKIRYHLTRKHSFEYKDEFVLGFYDTIGDKSKYGSVCFYCDAEFHRAHVYYAHILRNVKCRVYQRAVLLKHDRATFDIYDDRFAKNFIDDDYNLSESYQSGGARIRSVNFTRRKEIRNFVRFRSIRNFVRNVGRI